MQRKIEVYSQKSGYKQIMSAATTWSQLKTELVSQGYDLSGQSATENIRKTLLNDNDNLPSGDFKVFLRQTDAKGGASTLMINSIEEDSDLLLWINLNYSDWKSYNDEKLEEIILDFQELEIKNTAEEFIDEESEEFINDLDDIINYYDDDDFQNLKDFIIGLRKIRLIAFKKLVKKEVLSDEEKMIKEYNDFINKS